MNKKSILLLVCTLCAVTVLSAVENEKTPSALTFSATLGFPTSAGIGSYYDLSILDTLLPAERNYITGIDFDVRIGTSFGSSVLFADKNKETLEDRDTTWEYSKFPDVASNAGLDFVLSMSSFTYWYTLKAGAVTIPIGAGIYMNFGSTSGDYPYNYVDIGGAVKALIEMESIPLVIPFVELGLGSSSVWIPGLQKYTEDITVGTQTIPAGDDVERTWSAVPLRFTIGARYDIPFSVIAGKKAKKAEAQKEKVIAAAAKELSKLGAFQFPKWLRDFGGGQTSMTNDMFSGGVEIMGAQVMFGKFSFKHQSTIRENSFNKTYKEADVITVIKADDKIYEVKLRDTEKGEVTYKLERFLPGQKLTIGGKTITADEECFLADGKVFLRISTKQQSR